MNIAYILGKKDLGLSLMYGSRPTINAMHVHVTHLKFQVAAPSHANLKLPQEGHPVPKPFLSRDDCAAKFNPAAPRHLILLLECLFEVPIPGGLRLCLVLRTP